MISINSGQIFANTAQDMIVERRELISLVSPNKRNLAAEKYKPQFAVSLITCKEILMPSTL
jgi:hypothetical protein